MADVRPVLDRVRLVYWNTCARGPTEGFRRIPPLCHSLLHLVAGYYETSGLWLLSRLVRYLGRVAKHFHVLDSDEASAHGLLDERENSIHFVLGVYEFKHDG